MKALEMDNYLPMCTCTHLLSSMKQSGVGAPVAQGGIGHRAIKYMKIKCINIKPLNRSINDN